MSISGAISNALSGLLANSRRATTVSANLANALTEGYGRRSATLASQALGGTGGVRVTGIERHYDTALLADRWLSDAGAGFASTRQAFVAKVEADIGTMQAPSSLAARLAAFEGALSLAAADPASPQRLSGVSLAATDLAESLSTITAHVQESRTRADASIATGVERLNAALGQVEVLNDEIAMTRVRGGDSSSLLDERQRAIDTIADLVPVRIAPRPEGKVALYTSAGAVLLDGKAGVLDFAPTFFVTAGQTLAGGQLSGLTLNGNPIASRPDGPLGGGTLGAHFQVRDVDAVALQEQLDAVALELASRFGAGGPDATLAPGDPGLFTDEGLAVVAPAAGLAGRLTVNPLVAPGSAELWRLRDGLGAAAPGEVGDGSLLNALNSALSAKQVPAGPALGSSADGLPGLVATLTASVGAERVRADRTASFAEAQNVALRELEFAGGVDTDNELQTLLRIEQNYAANAQVLTTIDDMINRILAI